jgi:hypothetical protein
MAFAPETRDCRSYGGSIAGLVLAAALLWAAIGGASPAAAAGCTRPIRVASSPVGLLMTVDYDGTVGGPDRAFLTMVGQRIGCEFRYDVMSRARAFQLMATGETDLIPSAIRTEQRDGFGELVVFYHTRALLITLRDRQLKIRDTAGFLASGLTLDLVRGYDYGGTYRWLEDAMASKGRLAENVDPAAIARKLLAERTDATIMSAQAFSQDALAAGIADKVTLSPLDDLPAFDTGVYVVRAGLDPGDAALLISGMRAVVAEGHYTALVRAAFVKPRWALEGVEFADEK